VCRGANFCARLRMVERRPASNPCRGANFCARLRMAHTWPAITFYSLLITCTRSVPYSLLLTPYLRALLALLLTCTRSVLYSLLLTCELCSLYSLLARAACFTSYLRAELALLLTSAPPVRVVMLGELSSQTGCYPHVTLAQMVGDHAELGLLYNM
jgi:hypothetical protein